VIFENNIGAVEKIQGFYDRWVPIMGLEKWNGELMLDPDDKTTTIADCCAQWEYKRFTITVYPPILPLNIRRAEWVIVHELVHVLYQPLRDMLAALLEQVDEDAQEVLDLMYDKHEDRVTSEVADALLRAHGYSS
jgi:hypothetical protein